MLLAQTAPASEANSFWVWVAAGCVVAAVLGLIALGLVLLFRHLWAERQLTHAERIKSLEAGFPLEPPETAQMQAKFMHNAFWIAFWLVVSVPAAAFSAASAASQKEPANVQLWIVIWLGAAAASIAAVIGAAVLMIYSRAANKPADSSGHRLPPKPL